MPAVNDIDGVQLVLAVGVAAVVGVVAAMMVVVALFRNRRQTINNNERTSV